MKRGYMAEFETTVDHSAEKIVVNLTGRLNKCGIINSLFDVKRKDLEKWQNKPPDPPVWFHCPDNLKLVSWTRKKQDENQQEGNSWDSLSRYVMHTWK